MIEMLFICAVVIGVAFAMYVLGYTTGTEEMMSFIKKDVIEGIKEGGEEE